jgi:hypothetical protein
VISVMIDYNLNYVQERTLEGNYIYNLDPWVLFLNFLNIAAWIWSEFVSANILDIIHHIHFMTTQQHFGNLFSFWQEPQIRPFFCLKVEKDQFPIHYSLNT